MRAALLAAVIVAALLAGLTQAPAAHADASFNQRMLELVNGQRAAAGVAPLRWSTSLGAAAEDAPYSGCGFTVPGRAMDMGQRNYFSHSILGCPNQNVFDLLNGLGVVSSSSGENIAWLNGTTDAALAAQRLTNDLMASPPHRANILNADYTHVGIGSWRTSTSQTWTGAGPALTNVWIAAQIFGRMAVTTAPAVGLNPTSVSFGDRTVGTTSPAQAITVNNQGDAALSVAGASLAGPNAADFRISANSCATVPAGSSCTVHVAFAPGSDGAKAATLSVSDNAAGSPHSVPLAGNGLAPAAGPAGVPVDVQATGGDAQISVSWSAAASGAAVEEYAAVLWDAGGYAGQTKLVCAACFSAGFTGLTNGRTYIITIHGRGPAGWGSPGASAWTMVAAKPAAPANVVVTQGNAQMTATWAPPITPGAAIDGYGMLVYDSTGFTGAWAWVCATCTRATVAGLTNGGSYFALVYAHNGVGWGTPAASSWITVGTPGVPGNVAATAGTNRVDATWTAAANSGTAITNYGILAFDPDGYVVSSVTVCGTCGSGSVTGLPSGRTYTIRVYAYNAFGWGAPSPPVVVRV